MKTLKMEKIMKILQNVNKEFTGKDKKTVIFLLKISTLTAVHTPS